MGTSAEKEIDLRKLIIPAVSAAAFFGDVTHVANQTYNVESGAPFDGVSSIPPFSGIQTGSHETCFSAL